MVGVMAVARIAAANAIANVTTASVASYWGNATRPAADWRPSVSDARPQHNMMSGTHPNTGTRRTHENPLCVVRCDTGGWPAETRIARYLSRVPRPSLSRGV